MFVLTRCEHIGIHTNGVNLQFGVKFIKRTHYRQTVTPLAVGTTNVERSCIKPMGTREFGNQQVSVGVYLLMMWIKL